VEAQGHRSRHAQRRELLLADGGVADGGGGEAQRMVVVGQPAAELAGVVRAPQHPALAAGDDLAGVDPGRVEDADEAPRRSAAEAEGIEAVGAGVVAGGVDGAVAAGTGDADQTRSQVREAAAGRHAERTAEGMVEDDAVQPPPAVLVLVGGVAEGRRERVAGEEGEGRAQADQQGFVAPLLPGSEGIREEVDAGSAEALVLIEGLQEVRDAVVGQAAVRQGRTEAEGDEGVVDDEADQLAAEDAPDRRRDAVGDLVGGRLRQVVGIVGGWPAR